MPNTPNTPPPAESWDAAAAQEWHDSLMAEVREHEANGEYYAADLKERAAHGRYEN